MPLLNGRPILAFLRALVGAFKAKKSFVPRFAGFSGHFSDVSRHIGGKTPLNIPLNETSEGARPASGGEPARGSRGANPRVDISTLFGQTAA
jgi:hypothetical protein